MNLLEMALWAQRIPAGGPGNPGFPGGNPAFPGGNPGFPNAGPATSDAVGAGLGIFFTMVLCFWGFWFLMMACIFAGVWKTFTKAGQPGWAAIIPIYNVMVMAKIAGRQEMDGLLCLIPVVGIYFLFLILNDFVKKFGKDTVFAILLIFFPYIFWPMLGFGSARYSRGKKKKKKLARDDDEDDLPRKKRRPLDEDEEDEEEAPRRRRPAALADEEDEEEEERPKRRKLTTRDEDEDEPPKRKRDERTRRAREDD